MNIAVLSLTRDRLDYTKHCFGTLVEHAGCEFDWWITDQGSEDGTVDWLIDNTDATVTAYSENIGICPALNLMIEDALASAEYDVVVKVDNDCEIVTPNTLRDVCAAVLEHNAILSPHIHGLNEPPPPIGQTGPISERLVVGGIFMAVPAWMFKQRYRHPETTPLKDGDDYHICRAYRAVGGKVGYLDGYDAWHYETTKGQHQRYPDYFARRRREALEAEGVAA